MPVAHHHSHNKIIDSLVYGVDISLELANPDSVIAKLILDDVAATSLRLVENNKAMMRQAFIRLQEDAEAYRETREKRAQAVTMPQVFIDKILKPEQDKPVSLRLEALVGELRILYKERAVIIEEAAAGITLYRAAVSQLISTKNHFVDTVSSLLATLYPAAAVAPAASAPVAAPVPTPQTRAAVKDTYYEVLQTITSVVNKLNSEQQLELSTAPVEKINSKLQLSHAFVKPLAQRFGDENTIMSNSLLMSTLSNTTANTVRYLCDAERGKRMIYAAERALNACDTKISSLCQDSELQAALRAGSVQLPSEDHNSQLFHQMFNTKLTPQSYSRIKNSSDEEEIESLKRHK